MRTLRQKLMLGWRSEKFLDRTPLLKNNLLLWWLLMKLKPLKLKDSRSCFQKNVTFGCMQCFFCLGLNWLKQQCQSSEYNNSFLAKFEAVFRKSSPRLWCNQNSFVLRIICSNQCYIKFDLSGLFFFLTAQTFSKIESILKLIFLAVNNFWTIFVDSAISEVKFSNN